MQKKSPTEKGFIVKVILHSILFALLCSTSNLALAKSFTNSFLDFDLPPNYNCKSNGGSWTCVSQVASDPKGIIVITAKKSKVGVNLRWFKNKLSTSKTSTWNGKKMNSTVLTVEETTLKGHKWILSTHTDGELPNSITKYLASVKNGLSILVSFTAHNQDYPKLANKFNKAISSVKIKAGPSNKKLIVGSTGATPKSLPGSSNNLEDLFGETEDPFAGRGGGFTLDSLPKMAGAAFLGVAIILLVLIRIKKK